MLCNNSGGINVTTNRQTQISKIIRILVVATEYSTEYKLRPSSRQQGFNHYDNPTSTNKIVAILLKSPKHQLRHKYIYIYFSLSLSNSPLYATLGSSWPTQTTITNKDINTYIYFSLSLSLILFFMLHWGPLDPPNNYYQKRTWIYVYISLSLSL